MLDEKEMERSWQRKLASYQKVQHLPLEEQIRTIAQQGIDAAKKRNVSLVYPKKLPPLNTTK